MPVETSQKELPTQALVPEVAAKQENTVRHEAEDTAGGPVTAVPVAPRLGSPEAKARLEQGEDIIRRNTLWAAGAGAFVVFWPFMDVVAASAVQLKMLKNLSDLYGVKFSEGLATKLVGALVMSSSGALWGDMAMNLLRFVPGVGAALGAVSAPLMASAFAHALGRVYLVHLESGGSLLDFDPQAMQERFKLEFEKSKQAVVQAMKEGKKKMG